MSLPMIAVRAFGGVLLALGVCACAPLDDVLPGDRTENLRDLDAVAEQLSAEQDTYERVLRERPASKSPTPDYAVMGEAVAFAAPRATDVSDWGHRFQNAAHAVPHLALRDQALVQQWHLPIGAGSGLRTRITASPVAEAGRLFVMDALATVSAVSADGVGLWQTVLVPPGEIAGEVQGGGLAVDDGQVFATTAFGQLHVLDGETGATLWVQDFDAAVTTAPVVDGTLVYVVTRNGFGYALDRDTGRIVWEIEGDPASTSVLAGGAPTIAGTAVILPFPSGQMAALLKQSGISLWTTSVSGSRVGRAYGSYNAISGAPVAAGDTVYVTTATGRLAAIDSKTGDRKWTALEGGFGPVTVAGGSVFVVSDEAKLIRLNATTGEVIWAATLPLYRTEKIARREEIYVHFGPVLAGGRLVLTSSDGKLREIDPEDGQLLRVVDLGEAAAAEPIIVDGTLYVITRDGALRAFR